MREVMALAAPRRGQADRQRRHAGGVERVDDLARDLADAELGVEVADDVDAQRRRPPRRPDARRARGDRGQLRLLGQRRQQRLRDRHLLAPERVRPLDEAAAVGRVGEVAIALPEVAAVGPQRRQVARDAELAAALGGRRGGVGERGLALGPQQRLVEAVGHQVAVEPALERVERDARRGLVVAVGPARDLVDAVLDELGGVLEAELLQRRLVGQPDAVLVLGEHVRLGGVEAAEVEQLERHAVDEPAPVALLDRARGEVPVGDVEAGVAQHIEIVGHPRHQVDPALVDEEAALGVDDAVALEPHAPPVEQLVGERRRADADEAEVVGARDQDVLLVGLAPVARHRVGEVRVEHEPVVAHRLEHLVQRRVQAHVRVEVDRAVAGLREHPAQEPRLHGRRELEHAVHDRHALEAVDVELVDADHVERLLRRVDVALDVVDDQDLEAQIRVLLGQRSPEHPRVGEVVLRDDRPDLHWVTRLRRCATLRPP